MNDTSHQIHNIRHLIYKSRLEMKLNNREESLSQNFRIMKYQARPKWDKNRPAFLKIGFICSIGFVLMAFNYTSYHTVQLEHTMPVFDDVDFEITPPPTIQRKEVLPPPPAPNIETVIEVIPQDEPIFAEIKSVENFAEPSDTKEVISDEYATPKIDDNPAIVTPIIVESPVEYGPVPIAERMPIYGDCDVDGPENERCSCSSENIMRYIYEEVKYPPRARRNGIEGTVVVSFIVTKSGDVKDIKTLRDIGGGCGAEVERVITTLSKFLPGKQNGRPVSVIYRMPVKFKLN